MVAVFITLNLICLLPFPLILEVYLCECGESKRNKQGKQSKKSNCPVCVRVGTNHDGSSFIISLDIDHHSHPLDIGMSILSSARHLPSEVQASIRKWVGAGFGATVCRQLTHTYYPGIQIDQRVFSNLLYRNCGLRPDQSASSKGQSQADQIINHLIGLKDSDPNWYYSKDVDPRTGRLRRVFWMSPLQRQLYCRYRDFIQTDNTSLTNVFNMPLTLFVVMDSNRHTRVVAAALSVGETIQDYSWALEHLLEATKDGLGRPLLPIVIMSDEDLALNAAMTNLLKDTTVFNCLWHIAVKNVPKNIRPVFKKRQYDKFISRFWLAQKALTK